jgi:hypothetical protein
MDDYIVAFWDTHDYHQFGPTQVHRRKGDTVKDTQDRMAAYAGEHPEIIYTVVREDDFRQFYRDVLTYADPSTWWVAEGPVPVEYAP